MPGRRPTAARTEPASDETETIPSERFGSNHQTRLLDSLGSSQPLEPMTIIPHLVPANQVVPYTWIVGINGMYHTP